MSLEICDDCGEPTEKAGRAEDSIFIQFPDKEIGPLCEGCRTKYWICESCGEGVYPSNVTFYEKHDGCGGTCS
jgi:hypothetical protein